MQRRHTLAAAAAGVAAAGTAAAWSLMQAAHRPKCTGEQLWPAGGGTVVVLGIGGIVGAAWMTAVLADMAEAGWDADSADLVIGTSAGALVGSTLRAHLPAAALRDLALCGRTEYRGGVELPDPLAGTRDRQHRHVPHPGVGHVRLPHLTATLVSLLPPSGFRLDGVVANVDALHATQAWPDRPLWIPATSLTTGQRVVFGAPGELRAPIGQAVAASCAVPGLLAPVQVGGHWFVDGGVLSFTSADLAAALRPSRMVVLSPMASHRQHPGLWDPLAWGDVAVRAWMGRDLGTVAARARAAGAEVHVLTPGPQEVAAMGDQLLAYDRGPHIVDAVGRQRRYRDLAETLAAERSAGVED